MRCGTWTTRLLTLAVLFALVAIFAESAWACPTCKDAIQQGGNAANLVRGYFWSIMFMVSMPFLIFGSLTLYFYLLVRKARLSQAAPPLPELTTATIETA